MKVPYPYLAQALSLMAQDNGIPFVVDEVMWSDMKAPPTFPEGKLMSTSACLAVPHPSLKDHYHVNYVHYDGYPEGVGNVLAHVHEHDEAVNVVHGKGIRAMKHLEQLPLFPTMPASNGDFEHVGCTEVERFNDNTHSQVVHEDTLHKFLRDACYAYIFDPDTQSWSVR